MLVLTRKSGQAVHLETEGLGAGIHITVVAIAGGRVRLGFEAPSNVRILRSELKRHESKEKVVEPRPSLTTAPSIESENLLFDD